MSDRASTDCPSTCSGDIYAGVPSTAPGMVSVTSAAGVQAFGHAEVEELRRAARGDHDVRRFQVAVQDASLVRSLQGAGNLDGDADRVF